MRREVRGRGARGVRGTRGVRRRALGGRARGARHEVGQGVFCVCVCVCVCVYVCVLVCLCEGRAGQGRAAASGERRVGEIGDEKRRW